MRTRPILILFVGMALALTLPGSAFGQESKGNAEPNNVHVDLIMPAELETDLFVKQKWDGERAKQLRQSLDVYFGAADGMLTPDELDKIARATEADMSNHSLPWVTMDDAASPIEDVTIAFSNASGSAGSTAPIEMTHRIHLTSNATTQGAQEHRIRVSPMWNGTIAFEAPAGWGVSNVTGLEGVETTDTTALGSFQKGTDYIFTIVPLDVLEAQKQAQAEESTPDPDATSRVPGPGAAMIMLAASGAAVLVALRRRRS